MTPASLLASPGLKPVLAALPQARLVGGCVRDMLANHPVTDIDLATPDPPEAVLMALEAAGLRAIPTGLAHGTVTAISEGHNFEITTLRRDEETDGRHARVAWTDDFAQDAARRDFTINAMSLDQAGQLHDYFGGAADLASKHVRFVGDAGQRVAEDFLRILRFFRFYARYGGASPDPAAVAAIALGRGGLATLSAERVWSELKRILSAADPRATVALMDRLGVLSDILPEGTNVDNFSHVIAAGAPPDSLLRLAALLAGDANALAERLKLSTAERERLNALRHGPVPAPEDDDATLRRLLAEEQAALLLDRLWLSGHANPLLRARIETMPIPVFPLEGRDVLALGASQGPRVGDVLRRVRAWWMEGGCSASSEALREKLAQELKA